MTDGSRSENDSEIIATLTETTKLILFEIDDLKEQLSKKRSVGGLDVLLLCFAASFAAVYLYWRLFFESLS